MATKKRFLDALDASDASDAEKEDVETTKKQKRVLTLEDLEKCGYKERPSILYVPEPKNSETGIATDWSDGRAHKKKELEKEETTEERETTERAVTQGVQEIADFAVQRLDLAEKIRQGKREEHKKLRKRTFNQKEKAKRDAGQASGGKHFIQEEKRIGRNFGLYSGFDT